MEVSLLQVTNRVKQLKPSKWLPTLHARKFPQCPFSEREAETPALCL